MTEVLIDSKNYSLHILLIYGMAILDFEVGAGEVPPTFQLQLPTRGPVIPSSEV